MVQKEDKGTLLIWRVDLEPGVIGFWPCLIMVTQLENVVSRWNKQTACTGMQKKWLMTYNRQGELSFHNHGKPRATLSTKKMCATLVVTRFLSMAFNKFAVMGVRKSKQISIELKKWMVWQYDKNVKGKSEISSTMWIFHCISASSCMKAIRLLHQVGIAVRRRRALWYSGCSG